MSSSAVRLAEQVLPSLASGALQASGGWIMLAYTEKRCLLFTQPTKSNAHLSLTHPCRHTQ